MPLLLLLLPPPPPLLLLPPSLLYRLELPPQLPPTLPSAVLIDVDGDNDGDEEEDVDVELLVVVDVFDVVPLNELMVHSLSLTRVGSRGNSTRATMRTATREEYVCVYVRGRGACGGQQRNQCDGARADVRCVSE